MNDTIQSLWVGSKLSSLERLSIESFLHHGHDFDLYTYGEVDGVPARVTLRDAGEILPQSRVFRYTEGGSYAGFSNYFRYRLLLEKGGWWVDTDVVCLRPFNFPRAHVFASERLKGTVSASTGIMKAPQDSPAIQFAWERCDALDPAELRWGQTGAKLLNQAIDKFELRNRVSSPECFCPIPYTKWEEMLDPATTWNFEPGTHSIHLWNEMWRRADQDKDGEYSPECLYEHLKARYLYEDAA